MKEIKTPKTLLEAVQYFTNDALCVEYLSRLKWGGDEKCCTYCGSLSLYGLRTRPVFKCRDCKKQFSLKKGTIMEKSPLPITKWLPAIWLVVNDKNGISSYEVARALGVSQKTAWFMMHRVRESVVNGSMRKLSGEIEVDETYVGGKIRNMHKSKKAQFESTKGRALTNKVTVMGIVERKGEVRAKVVNDPKKRTLIPEIYENVEKGSMIFTDALNSYKTLKADYIHSSVDHRFTYVDGNTHTNTLENFWMLFKRCVKGTYVHLSAFHMDRYLDEQTFRYNNRKATDSVRFERAASGIFGKRLTYKELTGVSNQ
jgi:transposase-like protein